MGRPSLSRNPAPQKRRCCATWLVIDARDRAAFEKLGGGLEFVTQTGSVPVTSGGLRKFFHGQWLGRWCPAARVVFCSFAARWGPPEFRFGDAGPLRVEAASRGLRDAPWYVGLSTVGAVGANHTRAAPTQCRCSRPDRSRCHRCRNAKSEDSGRFRGEAGLRLWSCFTPARVLRVSFDRRLN